MRLSPAIATVAATTTPRPAERGSSNLNPESVGERPDVSDKISARCIVRSCLPTVSSARQADLRRTVGSIGAAHDRAATAELHMGHGEPLPILRPPRYLTVAMVVTTAIAANSGHIEYNFGSGCTSVADWTASTLRRVSNRPVSGLVILNPWSVYRT